MSDTPDPGSRTRPAHFAWSEDMRLGFAEMDDTHEEFVSLVDAMLQAPDSKVAEAVAAFAEHARQHFGQENLWMAETGCPGAAAHVSEHRAVLQSVFEVRDTLGHGATPGVVRQLALELIRWFPEHAQFMDGPLSQWMVRHRHRVAQPVD